MIEDGPPLPAANPALVGHEEAEAAFLKAWTTGRLAHAWLITGPRGIGKATFAYRIARHVLSDDGGARDGGLFGDAAPATSMAMEPGHPIFRRIAHGGHGDLKVVERAWADDKKVAKLVEQGKFDAAAKKELKRRAEIVVDDVRGVGRFLSLSATEGGWRVVVIDAADEMNRNAANAVLKVLEEPPEKALLMLVSHNPGRLLPTIRSRCRTLPLRPLAEHRVEGLLANYLPDVPDEDRAVLARLAEGSVGRAIDLWEEGGLELDRQLLGVLTTLPRLDVPAAHAMGDKVARSPDAMRVTGELLTWWLARMVRAGALAETPPDIVPGEGEVMRRLTAAASLDKWREVWEKITHSFNRAEAVNLDAKQVLINAFLSIQKTAGAI